MSEGRWIADLLLLGAGVGIGIWVGGQEGTVEPPPCEPTRGSAVVTPVVDAPVVEAPVAQGAREEVHDPELTELEAEHARLASRLERYRGKPDDWPTGLPQGFRREDQEALLAFLIEDIEGVEPLVISCETWPCVFALDVPAEARASEVQARIQAACATWAEDHGGLTGSVFGGTGPAPGGRGLADVTCVAWGPGLPRMPESLNHRLDALREDLAPLQQLDEGEGSVP